MDLYVHTEIALYLHVRGAMFTCVPFDSCLSVMMHCLVSCVTMDAGLISMAEPNVPGLLGFRGSA